MVAALVKLWSWLRDYAEETERWRQFAEDDRHRLSMAELEAMRKAAERAGAALDARW